MSDKPKCSGTFCPLNYTVDISQCELYEKCEHYTPLADMSGMESVVDVAMKQFNIEKSERQKLKILFDSYVSQYMATFCRL